ncbi:YfjI family protein [Polaribacter sp.]|nr:YfjI family protein [Polaribacter sp.]
MYKLLCIFTRVTKNSLSTRSHSFPTEIFPRNIQKLIINAEETVGYNPEYLSAGILSTCATAIGSSVRLNNGSYDNPPILWLNIIGRSGDGKTHPLKFAKQPIAEMDKKSFTKFHSDMQKYSNSEDKNGEKPIYNKTILSDFTPEKLSETLQHNKKGVLIFRDELLGWIKSFDKYKKGGDQQMYLEFFNGDAISVDRVSKGPIRVENPNVNILGGMQPKVLKDMASNNREDDGFLARFLFVYPEYLEPKLFTGKQIDESQYQSYNKLIQDLFGTTNKTLKTTESQIEIYKEWQSEKVKQCYKDDLETLIQSKLETYVWRLALILEMIEQTSTNTFSDNLSDKSLNDAIILVEYFRNNALRVYNKLSSTNPLDNLEENKFSLYKELPMEFKKSEQIELFTKHNVRGGSIGRFLCKDKLFVRLDTQGNYKKKFK